MDNETDVPLPDLFEKREQMYTAIMFFFFMDENNVIVNTVIYLYVI